MSHFPPVWRHSRKEPSLSTQLRKHPGFTLARFIVTFLLIILVFTDTFVNVGSSLPRAQAASLPQPTRSSLNLQQYLKQGRPDTSYHGPLVWNSQPENPPPDTHATKISTPLLPSHQPAHMQPITQSLPDTVLTTTANGKDVSLIDNNKSFEVHLPASSFDLTHAVIATGTTSKTAVPHGPFTITVKQLAGHGVGMMNVLGSYQLQVFDSQQHTVTGILLKQPISLVYHYQPAELTSLNLDAAHMVLSLPDIIAAVQNAQKTTYARLVAQQVAKYTVPLTNNPTAHTLTAQLQVMPYGPADFAGDPLNQSPPTPHLASMGGNAGQSGYAYPLQVPPGPAGFAPNLALAYSSSDPNGRQDRTSPAGGLGDGWGLSLGSISTEVYPSTSASPGSWFFLSGIAGASDRLVPDTTAGFFQTEHISRLKIQLVTSSVTNKPCFNVWDKDGTYYQIGCTADSLQYYNTTSGSTNYRWDVNRIIAPNQGPGSTYKLTMVSYEQDKASDGSVRDAAIKQVTYGSGTTTNAISSVDGTVDFHYRAPSNDGAWAVAYGTNYNCTGTVPGGSTTLRCDDPVQQSGSSVAAPKVMSTLSLQNVISYVGDDSATTHAAYEYDFSYQDNVFIFPCYDPYTLVQQSCAGEHLLKQIVPKVYLKGTSHQLKPVLFGYSGTLENFYTDENHTQQGNTTFYNVQTYWQYLTNYFDSNTGIGGQISYQTAYSNTEGTPYVTDGSGNVIDDRHDPLYCTKHANDTDTTKRCSTFSLHHPDDQTWSVQVVTQIKTWGVDSTSTALQPAVTSYAYKLAATGTYTSGNFCYPASQTVSGQKDCVGDTWIPASNGTQDGDWQDFYHGEFHGFSQVYITSPSGNLTVASYNSAQDQLSTLLLKSTTGTNLAQVAYTYDGNLRPTNASATWQSGSGQSGTIFSEGTSYDATSNVLSQVMQQAAVPGQSNSGGTEAQNFCYDEQNRLVWASNSGTVPSAGNGTCGNLNFQSTLGGAYTNSYSYTHLGQLWEAPLNGNGTQEQYLYCNSSQPHQVTALAPDSGSPPTCSNMGTPDYQASYDNWGNMSSRTASGSTGALSFDGLDHLMRWNASFGSTNNEEWYMYDGTGNRVLRRYINGSGTTLVTYPFGLEEHTYGSSGTDQGDIYYYSVGGRTLGELSVVGSAQTTKLFLTDELGTIVSSFTNVGGSAVLNGNQAYGPYGNRRYHSGTLGTSKGFTGQYNDSNSGLDYYGSRYYDPVVGRFLSADSVQGNLQGADPYNYVGGNPETLNDPTGKCPWCIVGAAIGALVGGAIDYGIQVHNNYQSGSSNPWGDVNWGQVGLSALGGAIVGGTLGLAGTAVGLFGAADATVAGATTVADAGATAAATDSAATVAAATDTGAVTAATDTGAAVASDTGASTAAATSDAGSVTSTAASDTGATSTASAGAPEGATSMPEAGTTPEASTSPETTLYRGTGHVSEVQTFNDSGGYIMSDTARSAYMESRYAGEALKMLLVKHKQHQKMLMYNN